jgi:three-Cys-motif partner protein
VTHPFQFDEVGYWSELKLEIVEKYGTAYTTAFKRSPGLKKYYIDGFSGAGAHLSKTTGQLIDGSPARALRITPPFDKFYFIDMNARKTSYLQKLCEGRSDVEIFTGDCNQLLLQNLFPNIQYRYFNRALCLLDPYGLHMEWEVVRVAAQSRAVDLFLNFPVMDMNRNAIWHQPERAPQDGIERMRRFWGDDSWRDAAYLKSKQANLFGFEPQKLKQPNDAIVTAFVKRLKEIAGFSFVPDPLPMRNSMNAVVYYLFFASHNYVGQRIITDIFDKYR